MKSILFLIFFLPISIATSWNSFDKLLSQQPSVIEELENIEEEEIKKVIEEAYVKGVFIDRDPAVVREGFHPEFVLSVKQSDSVLVVTLDQWLDHLELDGTKTDDKVKHHFDHINLTGESAAVNMRIFINDQHVYTDFLSLYRFSDGWKIVNKIFQSQD